MTNENGLFLAQRDNTLYVWSRLSVTDPSRLDGV